MSLDAQIRAAERAGDVRTLNRQKRRRGDVGPNGDAIFPGDLVRVVSYYRSGVDSYNNGRVGVYLGRTGDTAEPSSNMRGAYPDEYLVDLDDYPNDPLHLFPHSCFKVELLDETKEPS